MRQIAEDKIRKAFSSKTIVEFIALFFLSISPYPLLNKAKTPHYFSSDFLVSSNNITSLKFKHPRVQYIMKGYDIEFYFFRNVQKSQPRFTIPVKITTTINGKSKIHTNEDIIVDFYANSLISFSFLNQTCPQFTRNSYTQVEFYGMNSGLSSFLIKIIPDSNPLVLYMYFQRISNTIFCIILFGLAMGFCLSPNSKEIDFVLACTLGFATTRQCIDLFITIYSDSSLVLFYSFLKCLIYGGAMFYNIFIIKKRLVPAFYPDCSNFQIYFYTLILFIVSLLSDVSINAASDYAFTMTLLQSFVYCIPTVISIAQIYDLVNTQKSESFQEIIQVNIQLSFTSLFCIISSVINYNYSNSNIFNIVDMWAISFFCGYIFYQRLVRDDERPLVGLITTATSETRRRHHKHRESSFESFALSSEDHKKKKRLKLKKESSTDATESDPLFALQKDSSPPSAPIVPQ